MKQLVYSFVALFASFQLTAQKADLWAKSSDKGLYIEHKVVPKESFFSVGRLYNVSPKFIAGYNKLDISKGLQIDQKIRIPLTDTNFTQKGNSGTPVYYKTGENEGLMKVSSLYNNVTLEKLRDWNDLKDNSVPPGKKLIIGFLQSKGMPSLTIKPKPRKDEPVVKEETNPAVVNTAVVNTVSEETEKDIKQQRKEELKGEKKDEKKAEELVQKKEDTPKTEPVIPETGIRPVLTEQGYFKTGFEQQSRKTPPSKDETVTSGIFKTTSGWQDTKYYLLMDAVQPGTIVKIVNPENNIAVYAKVLGQMSGIRQNEGLNIRISNAAAAALKITDLEKFIVKVNY